MTIKNILIINVDWDFEMAIYNLNTAGDFVEIPGTKTNLKREDSKILNLAEKFELIWDGYFLLLKEYNISNILYIVGKKSSFSDARVIWIWLKSWSFILGNDSILGKRNIYLSKIDINNLSSLEKFASLNPNSLSYGMETKIYDRKNGNSKKLQFQSTKN